MRTLWGDGVKYCTGVQVYRRTGLCPVEKIIKPFRIWVMQQRFFRSRLTSSSPSRILWSVQDFMVITIVAFAIGVLILLQDLTDP